MFASRNFTRSALSLAVAALAGCAGPGPKTPAVPAASEAVPALADFSAPLRCMDNLLLDYGTQELSVMVESVSEQGRELGDGSKDVLTAAVSAMSQRSRMIRLAAGDGRSGLKPQFALRGAFAQVDAQTLAADFRMLATQDMTVVPGAIARNEATFPNGQGAAEIVKLGHAYRLPAQERAPLRRALAELGVIELFGRMAKVPYWTCLGASDDAPAVASEVRDWYDAMAARPQEIIEYFQRQLKARGVYEGPVDGAVNAPFKAAVARYREALGLSREPKLSKDLLQAHLHMPRRDVLARLKPAQPLPPQGDTPAPQPAADRPPVAAKPEALRLQLASDPAQFRRDQRIELWVRPTRDAHVYCFLQDESRKIMRFFPNRFRPDSRVDAGGLRLPGDMRFEIRLNAKGVPETVTCFATERDVLAELPAGLGAADFAPLPVASLEQLGDAFRRVGGTALAQGSLQAKPR